MNHLLKLFLSRIQVYALVIPVLIVTSIMLKDSTNPILSLIGIGCQIAVVVCCYMVIHYSYKGAEELNKFIKFLPFSKKELNRWDIIMMFLDLPFIYVGLYYATILLNEGSFKLSYYLFFAFFITGMHIYFKREFFFQKMEMLPSTFPNDLESHERFFFFVRKISFIFLVLFAAESENNFMMIGVITLFALFFLYQCSKMIRSFFTSYFEKRIKYDYVLKYERVRKMPFLP